MKRRRNTGTEFEHAVYQSISTALSLKTLGLIPECAATRLRPAYHSRDRNKSIVFDIAIELTLPGANEPSVVWIWECKDYASLVPVDDVEEFHAKLQQVGADRTKGTVITRVGFQESALNFAKSKGIGLAKLFEGNTVDWVLYRDEPTDPLSRPSTPEEFRRALTDPEYMATNQSLVALTVGFRTTPRMNWPTLVRLQLEEWGFSTDPG